MLAENVSYYSLKAPSSEILNREPAGPENLTCAGKTSESTTNEHRENSVVTNSYAAERSNKARCASCTQSKASKGPPKVDMRNGQNR